MEGEHLLDSKGSVQVVINNIDNLTFRGVRGHINSNIIIRCSSNTRGLVFNNGNSLNIYSITVTGCGQQSIPPLLFNNIAMLHIHQVMVRDNMYHIQIKTNASSGYTEGVHVFNSDGKDHKLSHHNISNSIFTNNTATDGGALYLHMHTYNIAINSRLTVTNSTFANNRAHLGAGLYIYMYIVFQIHKLGLLSINIINSTFANNSAINGSGLYIMHVDIYNKPYGTFGHTTIITITNSTFINNNATTFGGGLYIADNNTYDQDSYVSIATAGNIFTNNNADYGGGVYAYITHYIDTYDYLPVSYGNITFINSTFVNNKAVSHGGGLYLEYYAAVIPVSIRQNNYINNIAGKMGGGLYILYVKNTNINTFHLMTTAVMTTTVSAKVTKCMYKYLYMCIVIAGSNFTNNNAIQGGGLYMDVAYGDIMSTMTTIISNSVFISNEATKHGGGLYVKDIYIGSLIITNSMFISNMAANYGGGLYMYIHGYNKMIDAKNITMTNSKFANNNAGYGGGLYIILVSINNIIESNKNITISNSIFTNDTSTTYGGGLYIKYTAKDYDAHKYNEHNLHSSYHAFYHTNNQQSFKSSGIFITNSTITSNNGKIGAGMYISCSFINTYTNITDSTFTSNNATVTGGGLYIYDHDYTRNDVMITNSTFVDNNGSGLTINSLSFNKMKLSQIVIVNNKGAGILTSDYYSLIFTGHSIIANNISPTDGGGIYLGKSSSLTTNNGGHVTFINNTAHRYGGAIYSLDNDYREFSRQMYVDYDQLCTVYNLSADFTNNSAVKAGDNLFGGVFMFCSNHNYYNLSYDLFECFMLENMKNFTSVHPLSPISSNPLAVCPCTNGTINCSTRLLARVVYPGQIFHVSLVTVGLCGGVSPGTIIVKHDNDIKLTSTTSSDHEYTSCTKLSYIATIVVYIHHAMFKLDVGNGDFYNNVGSININLTFSRCPSGMILDSTLGHCVCDGDINQISNTECNTSWMPHPIQRSGNNWICHLYDDYNCTIAHTGCPFDYCNTSSVKFSLNTSELQCNYNRSGILCGDCKPGLSLMIGSNRCTNCTDTQLVSIAIVILVALAGILLVFLLIVLNLTVSVGSINGLLFYANVVKLNESVFFSQGNIPVISQFISWSNLDLGIEYCFIDGLDGYIKTWLQFAFPLYVWGLVIVFIIACRYSGRLARLTGHNAVPVLATLILMSYTKLSRTVTNALMPNTLSCGEHRWIVWNIDGNINYLSDKHIALFVVSCFFLIIGLIYTGLVFSSQWLQPYSKKCFKSTIDPVVRVKPLIDAYTGPFKDKYRFWTGLCLIFRLILAVVFSFTTLRFKLNNYIILLISVAMNMFRVYKEKYLTIIEKISYINLICLCMMTILFTDKSYLDIVSVNVIVSVSVSIEILLFVIIVIVHSYLACKKIFPNFKLFHVITRATAPTATDELSLITNETDNVVAQREPLLFDVNLN